MITGPRVGKGSGGSAVMEYAVFIIIILMALYFMKTPILRAFHGRWKTAGDSFAFGRQYDPKGTAACTRDTATRRWYDERCFDNRRSVCDTQAGDAAIAACERGIILSCTANCGEAENSP